MKISIVTAAWNSGATLRDTIESVLSQTYPDIEYIIVDGASKDNTVEIIREYEPRFNGRLKWISEPDRGIYDAMNKGIRMATGDVVGILNSDDFFTDSHVIEHIAKGIDGVDAVYGDIHFVNPDNLDKCVRYYSSRSFRPWQMRLGFMPAHPSFYCRKELFDKYGLYNLNYKSGADFDLLVRYIFINKIATRYIGMDFVTMRTGGTSTSGLKSYLQTNSDTLKALKSNGVYSNYFLMLCKCFYKFAKLKLSRNG